MCVRAPELTHLLLIVASLHPLATSPSISNCTHSVCDSGSGIPTTLAFSKFLRPILVMGSTVSQSINQLLTFVS